MSRKIELDRNIINMEMGKIREPKERARINFDPEKMEELAQSMNEVGLIHPIIIKSVRGGYEIVAGERRFLAAKVLKWKTIPVEIVKKTKKDSEVIKIHENLKRADLTDIEEARYIEKLKKVLGVKDEKAAEILGRSISYIKQKLNILKYPDYLYNAIEQKLITFSSARELVRITDEVVLRDYVRHAIYSGITPSLAANWARDWLEQQKYLGLSDEEKRDASEIKAGEVPRFPCSICGSLKTIEESRLVRICTDEEKCTYDYQERNAKNKEE